MSLIYALTYKGVANCSLNANFEIEKEKYFRDLLDIDLSEDLIGFIAYESYPNKVLFAKSPRDSASGITTII
ncbi:hypothetical protein [Facklamia sp. P13055]|uniref:hypothetical protein n=1 Tax=Facklamia sp. P13055 TaxID=3421952 RepID=UPI003D17F27E